MMILESRSSFPTHAIWHFYQGGAAYIVEDEENSSQRIYHVERSLQQSSKKDWDFPSGMLCPSIFPEEREDMKHETRMARLGVRSTSSTHHIHLDDYTHRIMSTLERESFLTISSLPTTYSIVLYCGCSEKAHFSTL